jgi:hypothetical protein
MDSKTARNNSRRGKRHELRLARLLGMAKVGPLQDAVDLLGRTFKAQVKTHKGFPPNWLAEAWLPTTAVEPLPGYVSKEVRKMEGLYPMLCPMVIHSYLPGSGYRPMDYIWVNAYDWGALHGHDVAPEDAHVWVIMEPTYFLNIHGED